MAYYSCLKKGAVTMTKYAIINEVEPLFHWDTSMLD